MRQVIKYHLDENMPNAVAAGLRSRDRGVTTSNDAGLVGAADIDQLAFANAESRVLVTRDRDFLVLHAEGATHKGIVYWTEKRSLGQLVRDLDSICFDHTAEELESVVRFL